MRTGTSLIYRIFTFTLFIILLAFIAGSLNLTAKRDYNTFKPYKSDLLPPSPHPSPMEASASDLPNGGIVMPEPDETTQPVETEEPDQNAQPDGTEEPDKNAQPDGTEEPDKNAQPDGTEEPDKNAQPDGTEEPDKNAEPDDDTWSYTFASQLPQSPAVDKSYFKNALFIGDSRTVGFCNFTGISKYCYARVSLNIKSVLTTEFIEDTSGDTPVVRTVLGTVKEYPRAFGKIYISFGVNEYSWSGTTFIACYEYFINALRDILPEDVPIYVQSVLPVEERAAVENGYRLKNDQLHAFNILLSDMAQRLDVYFVNTAQAITAADSFSLPVGQSGDGVHLNKAACDTIMDYLFTHTAEAGR
ncbi:MAG: GDSL-type esterase/lipase family protein [Eubacteriales bacterium]|nr:GDSL-type esterase/lipase family protein [Eubacteriales bacterium]